MGEPLNNAVGLKGFLTPRLFSRRTGGWGSSRHAVRVRRADGGEMANLWQRSGNVRIREELPTPARPSHTPLLAERCAVRHDQKIVMSSCSDDPQQGPKVADGPRQPRQARQATVRNAIKLPTPRPC